MTWLRVPRGVRPHGRDPGNSDRVRRPPPDMGSRRGRTPGRVTGEARRRRCQPALGASVTIRPYLPGPRQGRFTLRAVPRRGPLPPAVSAALRSRAIAIVADRAERQWPPITGAALAAVRGRPADRPGDPRRTRAAKLARPPFRPPPAGGWRRRPRRGRSCACPGRARAAGGGDRTAGGRGRGGADRGGAGPRESLAVLITCTIHRRYLDFPYCAWPRRDRR